MKKILLLSLLATLTACSGIGGGSKDAVVEDRSSPSGEVDAIVREDSNFDWNDSTQSPNNTSEFAANSAEGKLIAELKANNVKFILYFNYDDFDIDEATTQEIIKHANFMRNNPEFNLRLEGHADERGTREYNLALGENRAISVKELLSLYQDLGARTQVISYGEEDPAVEGHDEDAWAKNRRVEFVYQLNDK